jgi:hypothetical protein
MPKRLLATTIILSLILVLVIGIQVVEVVDANPLPPAWMNPKMTITIQSPQNGTDNAVPVLVNFTAQCSAQFSLNNTGQDWLHAFYYVLDGQNMSSSGINFTETQLTATHPTDVNHYFDYSGQAYLGNLNAGIHSITVYYGVLVNVDSPAQFIVYDTSWSATSQFSVQNPTSNPTQNPSTLPSASPSPTPTPTVPEFPLAGAIVLLTVVSISLVYFRRRKGKP